MLLGPILYAEDEENDVFFLRRALRQAQINLPLVVVSDGQKAMDYCLGVGEFADRARHPLPGLMLLDLNMPRKSGLEVLIWVRQESPVCTVPVIIFTSSLQEADIDRAYMHGANAYLVKPANPDEMVVTVKGINEFWFNLNRTAEKHRHAQYGKLA
jgi:DNA-binding response OmpR family regulator